MLSHVQEGQSSRDVTQENAALMTRPGLVGDIWLPISSAPHGIPCWVRDHGWEPFIATFTSFGFWCFDKHLSFAPSHWKHLHQ